MITTFDKPFSEDFVQKVKSKRPAGYTNYNLQAALKKHVSPTRGKQAMKSIFPPS